MFLDSFRFCLVFLMVTFLNACGGTEVSPEQPPIVTIVAPSTPPLVPSFVWPEASAQSQGMSEQKLEEAAAAALRNGTYGQAFLVIRNGKIVFERYRGISDLELQSVSIANPQLSKSAIFERYGTRNRDSLATSWSVAKSFTSILLGIAVEQGSIASPQDNVSRYISEWASDARSTITLKEVLDMRSGLVPICSKSGTNQLEECQATPRAGGDLVYADDQMAPCISRSKAIAGRNYGWWDGGRSPYPGPSFLYSNCDTMVLSKVLVNSRSEDFLKWSEDSLFLKIGMKGYWWKDNSQLQGGNVLGYCCIDATPRGFARLGELVLNRGVVSNQQIVSRAYIQSIIQASTAPNASYASQFWFPLADGRRFIAAQGFDGQTIAMDIARNIIVVRMGLYDPIFNSSDERIMKLRYNDANNSNWIGSLPQGMATPIGSEPYNTIRVLELVSQSVTAA
jgi:CubicO group peptidase (beta-lactamase class C family)